MSYLVDLYGFVKWDGPPPQLVKQHVAKFTKTGQSGISVQMLGVHGDSFSVQLTAVFPDQSKLAVAENGYRTLVGGTQVVTHNSINYLTAYGHRYLVESVETLRSTRHPHLVGRTYDYYGGWMLVSRWQFTPIVPI